MIFTTVGTQLPFGRLLCGMDSWAARNQGVKVIAQAGASTRRFQNMQTVSYLSQAEFRDHMISARLVVAHAGMGTILSAAELGLPVILMPRLAKFGEHRNDHQLDTAKEMARLSNVSIVQDVEALHQALNVARALSFPMPRDQSVDVAGELDPLIREIRNFVWKDEPAFSLSEVSRGSEAA
ncbi:MAG: glycosyltransferase [Tateyamaria sp.]|uniref:glycosyltransferase n=1 Tax=Tateyamaria sp. TaxID=1929288 RepID=UPI003269CA8D